MSTDTHQAMSSPGNVFVQNHRVVSKQESIAYLLIHQQVIIQFKKKEILAQVVNLLEMLK